MARQVFYSFHYTPDHWRASQVRNIGSIEGNRPATDNDWETIARTGDAAIQRWIDDQMKNRSATVLLIGWQTAGRKWINYEIEKSWNQGKGLVGIHIHRLKHHDGRQSNEGGNPFVNFNVNGKQLNQIVKTHSPAYWDSKDVYKYISDNISDWVEEAIKIRNLYP